MAEPFFRKIKVLDELIAAGPHSVQYEKELAELLRDEALNEYFFIHLSEPDWLQLLVEKGQFRTVPDIKHVTGPNGPSVYFPFWPEGTYLLKIASLIPKQVSEVVRGLPSTGNVRVYGAILDIALSLTSDFAVRLLPKILEGIRSRHHFASAQQIPALITQLVNGGQGQSALVVATAALELFESTPESAGESAKWARGGPVSHFDAWTYEQILKKATPDLVDGVGRGAIELFCDLLDHAIAFSARVTPEQKPHDYSYIWRPAVEDNEQNRDLDLRGHLVTAVRDSLERFAGGNTAEIPQLVHRIEKRSEDWSIFKRIALDFLRRFAKFAPSLVRERLTNRELFDAIETRHEFFLLQAEHFGFLTSSEQQKVFEWIESGREYSREQIKKWEEFTGKPWTEADEEKYIRQWKRDRLSPLRPYLDEKQKNTYAYLLFEEGEPYHPEFVSYSQFTSSTPWTPHKANDLVKYSATELVKFLNNQRSDGEVITGADQEGLSREVTTLIALDPERYISDLPKFQNLSDPAIIRGVIEGFHEALRQNRKFEWSAVLDFCVWIVAQMGKPEVRRLDSQWSWTRASVVRLSTAGISSHENRIPFEDRAKVWVGIESGTHDTQPTPSAEREYWDLEPEGQASSKKSHNFDPFTNAINTARGVAIDAVVIYALWVQGEIEKVTPRQADTNGFVAMAEVEAVLNSHLDPLTDPTITIRAIYGQRVPWLQKLDERWARTNTSRIFPRSNSQLWHAAWDTYVGYNSPYDPVFDWLIDEYRYATQQIGQHQHGWKAQESADVALGRHLMTYYWRGKIKRDSDILSAFFQRGDATLREATLSFVGRSLRNTSGSVADEVRERLQTLWTERLNAAKETAHFDAQELRAFGWWFISAKFEVHWSLVQLNEALTLARQVEPDFLVVERLAVTSQDSPLLSVTALTKMVEGDVEGWNVSAWRLHARQIISAAIQSDEPSAREAARDLINLLGSRRHFDFGDLLPPD